ncbi:MAG: LysR family transcriptional regulator [Acidobacteria bacterium]|nr:LysR family transcriptional regulator [Acidobacteriota bacterium]
MDFDQLHTFLEIVRLKSFSRAAQTCFRTQPAISAQIRQMEQELGTALFERFGSRISLTTAGKIFSEYAQQLLDIRRQAIEAVSELDHIPKGELVIAANEATCIHVLPEVFSGYKKRFPQVQVQVTRAYGARAVQAVLENTVDFAITQLPIQERKLEIVKIYNDEIRLLVPPGHPLARARSVAAPEAAEHPLLLPKTGRTRSLIDQFLEPVEGRLRISMELESTEMIKRFIMAGLGVGFMAVTNAREEIKRRVLRDIPLAPLPIQRTLGLIYRRDKPLSKAALGFIEAILDFARQVERKPPATEEAPPIPAERLASEQPR